MVVLADAHGGKVGPCTIAQHRVLPLDAAYQDIAV